MGSPPPAKSLLLRRLVMTVIGAAAVAAVVFAFTAPKKEPPPNRPAEVESVFPEGGDLDLRQVTIAADLAPGFTGVLLIDGVEVPEDDLRRVNALNQVSLQPQEDSDFRQFEPGRHCATVVYWPIGQTREQALRYRWCFSLH